WVSVEALSKENWRQHSLNSTLFISADFKPVNLKPLESARAKTCSCPERPAAKRSQMLAAIFFYVELFSVDSVQ
ncbi:MAG: hypothetical protein PVI76_11335, partial [Desulfobacterales bacterium]